MTAGQANPRCGNHDEVGVPALRDTRLPYLQPGIAFEGQLDDATIVAGCGKVEPFDGDSCAASQAS